MLYRKKHVKSKINKIKPKKSIFTRLWFWLVILFLIVISSFFYFFLFYSGVQVKNIVISGNQKVETEEIEDFVLSNINNKIFGIGSWGIYSKSIFLVNSKKLSQEILNKFSVIKSVKIDKKYMQAISFKINEKMPVAIFCPSLDRAIEKEKCYFTDDNGIIFESLSDASPSMVIVRQQMDSAQIFTGEKVVQNNIMDLISKLEKSLKDNFNISLKEAMVTSPLRLNISTSENWQIYFDLDDSSINSQLTKLNLLLNGEISASQRENLRYIDLRPKDRAIICDNKECGG